MLEVKSDISKANSFLLGMQIIKNDSLAIIQSKQCRIHKSKRINKKWAKRFGFNQYSKPDSNIYLAFGKICGHSETIKKMLKALPKQGVL